MPLHIDYRPRTLDEVFGNDAVKASLKSVLEREDVPHAFLFSGHYGCGKTTMGRIVADMLGCDPVDYQEIDGSVAKGIANIKELKKASRYAPMKGHVKVYLIDECHRLSGEAADAMLKELEDTPKHVYYILCTNEVQNLKGSIKSRCTEFTVNKLKPMEMRRMLKWIIEDAKLSVTDKVVEAIMKGAQGVARTGAKILDAVYNIPDEETQVEVALNYFDEDKVEVIELCRKLADGKPWKEIAPILSALQDQDAVGIRFTILGYFKACILKDLKNGGNTYGLTMAPFVELDKFCGWPELIHACWQTTVK